MPVARDIARKAQYSSIIPRPDEEFPHLLGHSVGPLSTDHRSAIDPYNIHLFCVFRSSARDMTSIVLLPMVSEFAHVLSVRSSEY